MTNTLDTALDPAGGPDRSILHLDVTAFTASEIVDLLQHIEQRSDSRDTYPTPAHGWTCFHCGSNFVTLFGAQLHFGLDAKDLPACKRDLRWIAQKPAVPTQEGWYRVMHSGDSESIDGHTIYDFPDYEAWAYWDPAEPDELEDFEGGYKGTWICEHDEEGELIFAFAGPVSAPTPYAETTALVHDYPFTEDKEKVNGKHVEISVKGSGEESSDQADVGAGQSDSSPLVEDEGERSGDGGAQPKDEPEASE